MIDSTYWKSDLEKYANKLRKITQYKRIPSVHTLENTKKMISTGFFIIRKLIESKKISEPTLNAKIKVFTIPLNDGIDIKTKLFKFAFDELYDFSKKTECTKDIPFLCNQFIHFDNCFYNHSFYGNRTESVLTTGIDRLNCIIDVPIMTIIDIFTIVANDYPTQSSQTIEMRNGKPIWIKRTSSIPFNIEYDINGEPIF